MSSVLQHSFFEIQIRLPELELMIPEYLFQFNLATLLLWYGFAHCIGAISNPATWVIKVMYKSCGFDWSKLLTKMPK